MPSDLRFDAYYRYDDLTRFLHAFAEEHPQFIRSSTRPYPYAEDPPDEGLVIEDVDGDGRIRQMRLKDPTGLWKVSAEDPRLMVRRDPTEVGGTYYRVFVEGRAHKPVTPGRRGVDATDDRLKVEWVVRTASATPGGGTIKLTARHERAGVVRTEVSLP